MIRSRRLSVPGLFAVAVAAYVAAQGATQTSVTLAGRNDAIPKLGRPGIAVRVDASTPSSAATVANELRRAFAQQVHTRPLAAA